MTKKIVKTTILKNEEKSSLKKCLRCGNSVKALFPLTEYYDFIKICQDCLDFFWKNKPNHFGEPACCRNCNDSGKLDEEEFRDLIKEFPYLDFWWCRKHNFVLSINFGMALNGMVCKEWNKKQNNEKK